MASLLEIFEDIQQTVCIYASLKRCTHSNEFQIYVQKLVSGWELLGNPVPDEIPKLISVPDDKVAKCICWSVYFLSIL